MCSESPITQNDIILQMASIGVGSLLILCSPDFQRRGHDAAVGTCAGEVGAKGSGGHGGFYHPGARAGAVLTALMVAGRNSSGMASELVP